MRAVEHRLREALSRRQKRKIVDDTMVSAAVLLPIYYKEGQYYILFTKRTNKVKEHKGQISFPGGAYEEGDEMLVNTALRECAEEIYLNTEDIEVLGELDDVVSRTSRYIISPFVGLISWPHQLKADGEEVEEIIEVSIRALLDRDSLRVDSEVLNGKEVPLYFYHYKGTVIWGATAWILNQFLDIFIRVIEDR